ncbi:Thioesterase-like superfamily, putative [Trypanosoma equiperdum]|uniref:Acyl-CoA thioesterase-like N-terminal HotDog domain-containing protein n=2 Tax=Trypanozoon TaxID=39700 RepID=Q57U21_TRYB2|nr:hypothetical protein Tb927.7.330 [Trypanosoma brucei brucei TREU927]AAX70897.1 hypothetical protein Tb927.7.330 [Trypanosoma brucei]AAZ12098.1 hypothetical protein Tb927.7.330 [Trypanosoma brucei brucei TREU927]SCU66751.1 Thioesterase-like superfamily, putative [Trypanosoma equiperdum]
MDYNEISPSTERRIEDFFAATTQCTRDVALRHASLNVKDVRMTFVGSGAMAASTSLGGDASDLNGSVVEWPMKASKTLASHDSLNKTGDVYVDQGVLSFLIDALTSAHLALLVKMKHVSVSLTIDFVRPLLSERPFILVSRLLRSGRRICSLSAEVRQEQNGKTVLCARADHTKVFNDTKSPNKTRRAAISKL